MIKESILREEDIEFKKLNLNSNDYNGLYAIARQIIQNMQILQQDCKNGHVTDEGMLAYIAILKNSVKKFETISTKK